MNETIFVIVENVPSLLQLEDVEECICSKLGYFTDENVAEATVNGLIEKHLAQLHEENGDDWEPTEEDETRFGFIPLDPANRPSPVV